MPRVRELAHDLEPTEEAAMSGDACGKLIRGGVPCLLDPGHRGQHRHTGVWHCDACGRARHGSPAAVGRPDTGEEGMAVCIVCRFAFERDMGVGRHT